MCIFYNWLESPHSIIGYAYPETAARARKLRAMLAIS